MGNRENESLQVGSINSDKSLEKNRSFIASSPVGKKNQHRLNRAPPQPLGRRTSPLKQSLPCCRRSGEPCPTPGENPRRERHPNFHMADYEPIRHVQSGNETRRQRSSRVAMIQADSEFICLIMLVESVQRLECLAHERQRLPRIIIRGKSTGSQLYFGAGYTDRGLYHGRAREVATFGAESVVPFTFLGVEYWDGLI